MIGITVPPAVSKSTAFPPTELFLNVTIVPEVTAWMPILFPVTTSSDKATEAPTPIARSACPPTFVNTPFAEPKAALFDPDGATTLIPAFWNEKKNEFETDPTILPDPVRLDASNLMPADALCTWRRSANSRTAVEPLGSTRIATPALYATSTLERTNWN